MFSFLRRILFPTRTEQRVARSIRNMTAFKRERDARMKLRAAR